MTSTFWDYYAAAGYDALRVLIPYEELQQAVVEAASPAPGERLLVAGCGTGNLEWLALQRVEQLQVEAVDFSPAMLARAQAKCAGYSDVRHQQADLCREIPLPAAEVDVAVMCNVLYALPDREAALREVFRVLRPGGRFILCDRQPWSGMRPIVQAHVAALKTLRQPTRARHWARTLAALPRLGLVALANAKIQQRYQEGAYQYLSVDEAQSLLTAVGFTVRDVQPAYAGQCWLMRADRNPVQEEQPTS